MTDQDNDTQPRTSRTRRLRVPEPDVADAGVAPSVPLPISPPEVPLASPSISPSPPTPVIEEIEPAEEPTLGGSGLRQHDVVQIIDPTSRFYGVFFAVGDVRGHRVHGYLLTEGRSKQFVTVGLDAAHPTGGKAKVRSANPCSQKWLSDVGTQP